MVKKILTTTSVFDLPYAVIWRVQLANGFLVAIVLLLLQPFQLHRLTRGKAFYQDAKEVAKHMQLPFNWQLHLVPGVGHNKVGMSKAAAEILYYR